MHNRFASRFRPIIFNTIYCTISRSYKNKMLPNTNQTMVDSQRVKVTSTTSMSNIPSRIIALDSNYCVIDKPFGVRMDGDFDITVEKLMIQWLPQLHGNTKTMKWVHQLDFATSGALCIGLSSPAAALASSAFEKRETSKQYLAVIEGHIDPNNYPCLSPSEISAPFELIHGRVQTKLERKLILDQIWSDDHHLMQKYSQYFEILQDLKATSLNEGHKYSQELAAIRAFPIANKVFGRIIHLSLEDFKANSQSRKALKKLIKFTKIPVVDNELTTIKAEQAEESNTNVSVVGANKRVRTDSDVSSDIAESDAVDNKQHHIIEDLIDSALNDGFDYNSLYRDSEGAEPFIYRMQSSPDLIHINIAVAEITDDFRMEPGNTGNPGKTAQTTLEILEKGYYLGKPVTKVRLLPRTGRRHQLRIHCLCLGHPIVGDYTYNILHRHTVDAEEEGNKEISILKCAERMMLHAHKLRIPVPQGIVKKNAVYNSLQDKTVPLVDVTAEDPFLFDNGTLAPVLPSYHKELS